MSQVLPDKQYLKKPPLFIGCKPSIQLVPTPILLPKLKSDPFATPKEE